MALDHYVPQVHLKNFYSPALAGRKMHAVDKRTLKKFICGSEDVCRVQEGSTNEYLKNNRAIELILKEIEPRYNKAIRDIMNDEFDHDTIITIAGFVSCVQACAPASMRMNSVYLRDMVEQEMKIIDRKGHIPPPPEILEGSSLTELLETGKVKVNVDQKYPQALGVSSISERIQVYGNSNWDILVNNSIDSPFFTSDYPVAFQASPDPRLIFRLVPLSPALAVQIMPKIDSPIPGDRSDFPNFRYRRRIVSRTEIRQINTQIVRSAEEQVYFRDDLPWIDSFVRKHAQFRLEMEIQRMHLDQEQLVIIRERLKKHLS